jgi:hypothetical protein
MKALSLPIPLDSFQDTRLLKYLSLKYNKMRIKLYSSKKHSHTANNLPTKAIKIKNK